MSRKVVDVHNVLAPALLVFADFWRAFGVSVQDHTSVLRFATGDLMQVGGLSDAAVDRAEALLIARLRDELGDDPNDDPLFAALRPSRVFRELSLRQLPGLILLEGGGFHDPAFAPDLEFKLPETFDDAADRAAAVRTSGPIELAQTLRLFPGQYLRGTGPTTNGTRLVWRGTGLAAVELLPGHNPSRVEDILIEASTSGLVSGLLCRNSGAIIEGTTISGFGVGLRVRACSETTARRVDLRGGVTGLLFEAGTECRGHVVIASFIGGSTAARLLAGACALVRCRIERGNFAAAGPLIEVGGVGNTIIGCHMVVGSGVGPFVHIFPNARAMVLEKNTYSTPAGASIGAAAAAFGSPSVPILRDEGTHTAFRDAAPRGVPPVLISTRNYLPNGDFSAEEPAEDPLGAPTRWSVRWPVGLAQRARAGWALPGIDPRGAYIGRGRLPANHNFGYWQAGEPTDPGRFFSHTSEVHLGRTSLWLGVRSDDEGHEVIVRQQITVDKVAPSFVLSGFIKGESSRPGPGRLGEALIRLSDEFGSQEAIYDGDGSWQQRTILYRRPDFEEGGGPFQVEVQCVVRGGRKKSGAQAFFDRLQFVPGEIVPHWQPFWPDDGMSEWPEVIVTAPGGGRQARAELRAVGVEAPQGLLILGSSMELDRDLLVTWKVGSSTQLQGLIAADIRRGDRSIFDRPITGIPVVAVHGDRAVGKIPLSRVSKDQRSLSEGDVLSLYATGEDLSVVLTGRCRRI